jgi:hypothetical protein
MQQADHKLLIATTNHNPTCFRCNRKKEKMSMGDTGDWHIQLLRKLKTGHFAGFLCLSAGLSLSALFSVIFNSFKIC